MLHASAGAGVQHRGAALSRGAHADSGSPLSWPLAALLLVLAALPAGAQSGLAPYRFSPPDDRAASGLDAEKARSYRDQLRAVAPREPPRGALDSIEQRELRRELFRVDRVLESPPPPPLPLPEPNRDLGPVVGSGGHPQPTRQEIEQRLAARQKRAERAGVDLRPVFDLFGERIQ